jgi:hypothetical protein
MDNDIAPVVDPGTITSRGIGPTTGVMPHALDPNSARRLWELSERLLRG